MMPSNANEEPSDCVSSVINGSPPRASNGFGSLDDNFEHCVRVICWLERKGYMKAEFRLKFLTWFCVRSTEQQRRVASTFIKVFMDDPKCLTEQLVHTFGVLVYSQRPRIVAY